MFVAIKRRLKTMKRPNFSFLFGTVFIVITAITSLLFITLGSVAIHRLFSYYVDKLHAETHKMLVMQIEMQFEKGRGFNAKYLAELGESSKVLGDYFTVTDLNGQTIYSNENAVTKCCPDPSHTYTHMQFPLHDRGKLVGYMQAGYFKNHLPSSETEAFYQSAIVMMVIAILAIMISSAILVLAVLRYLSGPIYQLENATKRLARGHWQYRVHVDSSTQELQDMAQSINVLAESLEHQEQFRQRLVIELSHELRTPLQILMAEIEGLQDGIHEMTPEHLLSMHAEVERLSRLIKELENRLIYETGTFDIFLEQVNVSELVARLVLGFEVSFVQKGLALEVNIEPDCFVMADSVRLAQAVINFLSNALKYTDTGRVTVRLTRRGKEKLLLSIRDTGPGIPPEVIEHVTERTRQPFKNPESRGVGLYIAALIIQKHRWQLQFECPKEGGTVVNIEMEVGELTTTGH